MTKYAFLLFKQAEGKPIFNHLKNSKKGGIGMKALKFFSIILSVFLSIGFFIVSAGAQTKLTLWYPAGTITAGAAHFSDKTLFADFETKNNCKVEMV